MNNLERKSIGISLIIIGIILLMYREYFIGVLTIICGILINRNIGINDENKLANYGLGIFCLIGAILFFFFPTLASDPNFPLPLGDFSKPFYRTGGIIFTIIGIYIILRTHLK